MTPPERKRGREPDVCTKGVRRSRADIVRAGTAQRGLCRVCLTDLALRDDVTVRRHGAYRKGEWWCEGSLQPPLDAPVAFMPAELFDAVLNAARAALAVIDKARDEVSLPPGYVRGEGYGILQPLADAVRAYGQWGKDET